MGALPVKKRLRRRKYRRPGMAEMRVRDLGRVLQARFGYVLPDNPAGRAFAVVMVQHLVRLQGVEEFDRVPSWCGLYAPWLTRGEIAKHVSDALNAPKYWKALSLGWHLKLSTAERRAWRITTIAAFDMSDSDKRSHKKCLARERMARLRARKGKKDRAAYLSEAKGGRPWLALGISRRTYFRRKHKAKL